MTTESLREAADRFFASMPFQVADPPRYPEGINSVTLTMAQAERAAQATRGDIRRSSFSDSGRGGARSLSAARKE